MELMRFIVKIIMVQLMEMDMIFILQAIQMLTKVHIPIYLKAMIFNTLIQLNVEVAFWQALLDLR